MNYVMKYVIIILENKLWLSQTVIHGHVSVKELYVYEFFVHSLNRFFSAVFNYAVYKIRNNS